MTDSEFKTNMDLLVQSLGMANRLASPLSNEDLRMLEETIWRADEMGMFLVPPIDYPEAMERLKAQREVIRIHRKIRMLVEEQRARLEHLIDTEHTS